VPRTARLYMPFPIPDAVPDTLLAGCRAGNPWPYFFNPRPLPMTELEKLLGDYAWRGRDEGQTHPVGQKRPNGWGLYDMYGSVWQWCSDWFEADYYAKSPADDPSGPTAGSHRVFRGGRWNATPWHCRSALRGSAPPGDVNPNPGFRVAMVVEDK
jgi:formylglycine-generating enzyme required for sulfatase activity